jgi:D-aminopeptidase
MRKRARELGLKVGAMQPGIQNMITDVPGVQVGQITIHKDLDNKEAIRTGVTAILPHSGNLFKDKVPAASYVLNGFGKTAGLIQVDELGQIESPIMLTNTFNVGNVWQATLEYMLENNPEVGDSTGSLNVVVGECNDMYLNSTRLARLEAKQVKAAIENAGKDVEEGGVGAGTGMMCFQYKGGVGTSSRQINDTYVVGVLVVSNFGYREELELARYKSSTINHQEVPDGSIMIIVGTNAPLSDRQLKRLAKRSPVGLAQTGSKIHHGSGDIVIAFSNGYTIPHSAEEEFSTGQTLVRDDSQVMRALFQGVAEATEEAILNSLTKANDTTGRKGRVVEGIPYDLLKTDL